MRDNIDKLLEAYRADLKDYILAVSAATGDYPPQAAHTMAMVETMLKMDDPIKLNRWFGFVQGVLFMLRLRTVEQLRDETRGAVHAEFAAWTRQS